MDEIYEIKVKGCLDTYWSDWFGGLVIISKPQESLLVGKVQDQAALRGIVNKIFDLGLQLISISTVENENI